MNEVLEFLKNCGTFFLATEEKDQPRVRPFGAICEFEGKLYIVTNNQKDVYRQMLANNKIEISGSIEGRWIRVSGNAVHDDHREARVAMLEACPSLGRMYSADDNLMEVLYLENVTATFCSFTEAPRSITF